MGFKFNPFTGTLDEVGTGGGTPGGSDTQVQFNDGGSTFGGDADFTWNKTTNVLGSVFTYDEDAGNYIQAVEGPSGDNQALSPPPAKPSITL
jgi:hypothetical protein